MRVISDLSRKDQVNVIAVIVEVNWSSYHHIDIGAKSLSWYMIIIEVVGDDVEDNIYMLNQ